MATIGQASDLVSSHLSEAVKTYAAYDGSDRLEYFYTAHIDIQDGEVCFGTQYVYDGASTRVTKTKEFKASWDGTWDI